MKHLFVIDPGAFSGQQWRVEGVLDSIGQYFRAQEKPDFTTAVSKFPREAIGIIQKQADEAGGDTVRVYAVGGDGILFDCLNGVAGLPNMELASVPYGAPSGFLRSFGEGKAELFKSIASVATSPAVPTDIIEAGNTYAITGCAVGFHAARAIKAREAEESGLARGLGRPIAGLRNFFSGISLALDKSVTACQYRVVVDGEDYSGAYSFVSVANVPHFGRKRKPLEEASPDDGFLDAVLFKSAPAPAMLACFGRYSRGDMPSGCVRLRAKKVEVYSDRPMWIQTDGECLMDTSISFEVVPGAARIVAADGIAYQRR